MNAAVFGPPGAVALPLLLALYLIPILGVVDASKKSAVAFYRAGYNKTAWIVVMMITMVLSFSFIPGGYYLLVARRRVNKFVEEH